MVEEHNTDPMRVGENEPGVELDMRPRAVKMAEVRDRVMAAVAAKHGEQGIEGIALPGELLKRLQGG